MYNDKKMKPGNTPGDRFYRSFLNHSFYDVEKINIDNPPCEYPSPILVSSSTGSILERCDIIRSQPKKKLKVLQLIAISYAKSNPGIAILIHDIERNEVYCILHLYDIYMGTEFYSNNSMFTSSHRTIIKLPGYNTDVKMILIQSLLLFCQPSNSPGILSMLDISELTSSSDILIPNPVLGGFAFLTCSSCYDEISDSALLSFLDTSDLLSIAIPVNSSKRSENSTAIGILHLTVPQGSLHFNVCRDIIVISHSRKTDIGWMILFFIGEKPVYKYELKVKICLYYCISLENENYLLLIAMDDGSLQTFQILSTSSIIKGDSIKVFEGDIQQRKAVSFSPIDKEKIALISKYQCALLNIINATITGVVSVLSIYDAPTISNMCLLKLNFPRELKGNFPFILLVSTLGCPCVRVFSFQRTVSLNMNNETPISADSSIVFDSETNTTTLHPLSKSSRKTGLFSHIKSILKKDTSEQSCGLFEPRLREENSILTLCQGFSMVSVINQSPPYELLALDPRLRGFLVCVSNFDSHDCFVLRDSSLQCALQKISEVMMGS